MDWLVGMGTWPVRRLVRVTLHRSLVAHRVMDYDTYSAHDPIGQVYIRLNNLVQRSASSSLEGWFPIYDTLHGIRGALKVKVQVELFSDQHFFRSSSCGMMFFTSECVLRNYDAIIHLRHDPRVPVCVHTCMGARARACVCVCVCVCVCILA